MVGMGLKFTPVIGRHLLHHSSMLGPMAGTSATHSLSKKQGSTHIHPSIHPLPLLPSNPLQCTISDITVVLKEVAQTPAV